MLEGLANKKNKRGEFMVDSFTPQKIVKILENIKLIEIEEEFGEGKTLKKRGNTDGRPV